MLAFCETLKIIFMSKELKNSKPPILLLFIVIILMAAMMLTELVTCASGNPLPMWEKKSSDY